MGKATYRKIVTSFWSSTEGTADEALAALWLLTGPQTTGHGLQRVIPADGAARCRFFARGGAPDVKRFERTFLRVCSRHGWRWEATYQVLWIPTWWEFNRPDNPNQARGAFTAFGQWPPLLPFAAEYIETTLAAFADAPGISKVAAKVMCETWPDVWAKVGRNLDGQPCGQGLPPTSGETMTPMVGVNKEPRTKNQEPRTRNQEPGVDETRRDGLGDFLGKKNQETIHLRAVYDADRAYDLAKRISVAVKQPKMAFDDRRLIWKAAVLAQWASEAWIENALDTVQRRETHPKGPVAYLTTVLANATPGGGKVFRQRLAWVPDETVPQLKGGPPPEAIAWFERVYRERLEPPR